MPAYRYVEEIGSAAILATKRSVGVTTELNHRDHETCMLYQVQIMLPTLALKPRGDITRSPKLLEISGPTKKVPFSFI